MHNDTMTLDAATNPEEVNRLADEVMTDSSGSVPAPPPDAPRTVDDTVTLLAGVATPDGEVLTTAVVRGLTGRDEERIARVPDGDLARYKTTLLSCGVESIGGHEPSEELLKDLLVGDRDYLMLHIRAATYGPDADVLAYCKDCDSTFEAEVDITTLPTKTTEPAGRLHTVDLANGRRAKVRLASGYEEAEVVAMARRGDTAAEVNTALLGACVTDLEGALWLGADSARDLGLRDRKTLLEFLSENQPGVQLEEVSLVCENCEVESKKVVDLGDLFRL